jgi:hypothetical protein
MCTFEAREQKKTKKRSNGKICDRVETPRRKNIEKRIHLISGCSGFQRKLIFLSSIIFFCLFFIILFKEQIKQRKKPFHMYGYRYM